VYLKLKKIVAVSAAIILIVAWFTHGILENTFVSYPRFPNPDEGLSVPYAVKGIIVYITKEQQNFLSWLTWIEITSGLVAAFVILIHWGDPFKTRE
jgi:hypothetical protein